MKVGLGSSRQLSSAGAVVGGLRLTLLAGCVLYVAAYVTVALARFRHPYELEWMEGAMVDHVVRLLSGERLYVPPSVDFTPFIYTPLYFYLAAVVAKVAGIGFTPLRVVSIVSSLVSFAAIYSIVKRESGDRFAGLVAVGAFAATYRVSGAWFDVARVDSLALALLLAGVLMVRYCQSRAGQFSAAMVLAFSCLTKQSMLVPAAAMVVYVGLWRPRHLLWLGGPFVLTLAVSTWILNRASDGWFTFYVLSLPRQHPYVIEKIVGFWRDDLVIALPVFVGSALAVLVWHWATGRRDAFAFYALVGAGTLATAWVGRIHQGGYDNVLIPGFAGLSILVGLAVAALTSETEYGVRQRGTSRQVFVLGALCVQLATLVYNPVDQVPSPDDVAAGDRIVGVLSQAEGDVLVPSHGFLAHKAGKASHAHWQALADVMAGRDDGIKKEVLRDLESRLRLQSFDMLVLDGRDILSGLDVETRYRIDRKLFESESAFWPVTGARTRPQFVFVPR